MLVSDLLKLNNSFNFVLGSDSQVIDRIADKKSLNSHSLFFIKEKKFWQECLKFDFKNYTLAVDLGFFEKEKTEIENFCHKNQLTLLTSTNIPLALALTSKIFFDKKMNEYQVLVDARQLGTVNIHPNTKISQNVFIGEHVTIKENVTIMPGVVLMGQTTIDEGTTLFPNVTVYPFTTIGKNVRIHAGTVVGSDGFGYHFHQGQHIKIWHMGGVEIKDNAEIGSNCSIDMGTFSPTIIGQGSIIDNLVQIAHNTNLGSGTVMCGQSGISGSSTLGDYTVVGGKAGVVNDIEVGPASQIAGNAMVMNDLPAKSIVGGHPARPIQEWMRGLAYLRKESLKKKS